MLASSSLTQPETSSCIFTMATHPRLSVYMMRCSHTPVHRRAHLSYLDGSSSHADHSPSSPLPSSPCFLTTPPIPLNTPHQFGPLAQAVEFVRELLPLFRLLEARRELGDSGDFGNRNLHAANTKRTVSPHGWRTEVLARLAGLSHAVLTVSGALHAALCHLWIASP